MKTAIYVEDGIIQLVLTPDTDFEQNALSTFHNKPLSVKFFEGSFYDCRGGWVRQMQYYPKSHNFYEINDKDKSLIVTVREEEEK